MNGSWHCWAANKGLATMRDHNPSKASCSAPKGEGRIDEGEDDGTIASRKTRSRSGHNRAGTSCRSWNAGTTQTTAIGAADTGAAASGSCHS